MYAFTFFGATDVGSHRDNNEDTFITRKIWDEHHFLGVVIDGVGGYEGGEVASQLAAEVIEKYLLDCGPSSDSDLLKQAVAEANNRIEAERRHDLAHSHMACVLSAAIYDASSLELTVVHIGDTRIYRYRDGLLEKITHDHSFVGYLEEKGDLSEEQAMNHPRRNIIDRLLGDSQHLKDDRDFLEENTFPVVPGDRFLFCSDGLTDMVTSSEIIAELAAFPNEDELAVSNLIKKANQNGGADNITVIVLSVASDANDESPHKPDVIEEEVGGDVTDSSVGRGDTIRKAIRVVLALDIVLLLVLIGEILFLKLS